MINSWTIYWIFIFIFFRRQVFGKQKVMKQLFWFTKHLATVFFIEMEQNRLDTGKKLEKLAKTSTHFFYIEYETIATLND